MDGVEAVCARVCKREREGDRETGTHVSIASSLCALVW